jgi:hypothetical protein
VVSRLVYSEVVDAGDDRHAERTAGFAGGVVDGRSDPGLGGGRTPRIDSVAGMVMAPIAEPIITIWIAITGWGSVAEAWAIHANAPAQHQRPATGRSLTCPAGSVKWGLG